MADRRQHGKLPFLSHHPGSLPSGKELQPARRFLRPGALRKFQTSRHLANKKQQQHKLSLILSPALAATNGHMVVDTEPVLASVDAAASETMAIIPVNMQPAAHEADIANAGEGENLAGDLAIVASQEMFVPAQQEYFYCPPPHTVSSRPVNKQRRKLYASPPCFILTRRGRQPQEDLSLAHDALAAHAATADEDVAGYAANPEEMALEPESRGTERDGFSEFDRYGREISRRSEERSDDHSASGNSHGSSESSDSHDSSGEERQLEVEIHSDSRNWQIVPFLGRDLETDTGAEQEVDSPGRAPGGRALASGVACSPRPTTASALSDADVRSPSPAHPLTRTPLTAVSTRVAASPLGGPRSAQQQLRQPVLSPEPCTPPSIALATALRMSLSIGHRVGRSALGQQRNGGWESRGTHGDDEEEGGRGACEERAWRAGGERGRMSSAVLAGALTSEGTKTALSNERGTTLDDMPHELLVGGMRWDGMGWDGMGWDWMGWVGMG